VNATDTMLMSPLIYAVRKNHFKVVKFLVDSGGDIHHREVNGWTLLMISALCDDEISYYLIDLGGSRMVDAWDNMGRTALLLAAQSGRLELVRRLIEAGADVNAISGDGSTPIFVASEVGNFDIVKCLLAHGAIED
jgi:ankyrin repeat protein